MLLTAAARTAATASTSLTTTAAAAPPLRRLASSIALKYSNAAFSAALAKSPQTLTKVQAELHAVASGLRSSPPLASFVANPTLSARDRTAGLDALLAAAAAAASEGAAAAAKKETVSDVTRNLFAVLSENGRLGETPGVIEGFNELVAKHKGEVAVVVTSAAPLDRTALGRLEAALKQSQVGQQAKILKITNKVNMARRFLCLAVRNVPPPLTGQPVRARWTCGGLWRQDN
jgi:F-type H+-transporting ATPase subunit O